jgi:hypothetical protein
MHAVTGDETMMKIDEIRNDVTVRGKSLLVTVADILDVMAKRNIAVATDVAGFAVKQVRLPAEVVDFTEYRERNKVAYSKFSETLVGHTKGLVTELREVPVQIADSLKVEEKPVKAAPKKVAAKAPVKKAAARKAPAKKAVAKAPVKEETVKKAEEKKPEAA